MEQVTVTMPLDSAANAITAIKMRMHDIQDISEKHPESASQEDVLMCYTNALNALNEAVPVSFRQAWVRT